MNSRSVPGLSAIAAEFDGFCIDQFGVMHDGQRPYPGAVDALTRLTAAGKSIVVLTNSGKRAGPNRDRIVALGFPPNSFTAVVSSGEVAWDGMRHGRFGPVFTAGATLAVVGKDGDDYGLDGLDITFTDDWSRAEGLLLLGSDCPRTSLATYRDRLARPARARIPALCCNPDLTMLTREGLQPSAGAIAQIYAELGGHVMYVGKPHRAIYEQAARTAGLAPGRLLAVGDSLDHDVAGGASAGFRTALVRTGILADLDETALGAALAAAPARPDYILPRLCW
jgi:HAD superfamily hydrolase (TIGR01459 family)